jgi:hypothetical protein
MKAISLYRCQQLPRSLFNLHTNYKLVECALKPDLSVINSILKAAQNSSIVVEHLECGRVRYYVVQLGSLVEISPPIPAVGSIWAVHQSPSFSFQYHFDGVANEHDKEQQTLALYSPTHDPNEKLSMPLDQWFLNMRHLA